MTGTSRDQPNRLGNETSPYLLEHAENSVDWYPWGEEALQKSRDGDRPIFLSIGYSACHWCHVMAHESFENDTIAEVMNRHFVNIKVDREERPDLDQIYMNAVLALTGRGGWPMSVFLTPDLKPFFGGTYWPPESRLGLPGFRDILEAVSRAWGDRRQEILDGAERLTETVARLGRPQEQPTKLSAAILENAGRSLLRSADRTHGGFGAAPKFPLSMDLRVLLRIWKRFGTEDALDVVRLTLEKMAGGGIYDHLGGGFHRYSTDAQWLVPHFEKMLYDNALLVSAYLEAYQATGEHDYVRVVRETLDYVLREMTRPGGGFYSTQDADSEGVEGKFFVWSEEEIRQHLEPDEARLFNDCYGVTVAGNWEGANILNRARSHAEAAQAIGIDAAELSDILSRSRKKIFQVRKRRIAPRRDDKLLVAWNGLMIAAMSQAAQILGHGAYADAAQKSADFILNDLRSPSGRLRHSYNHGQARFEACLDDFACLIDGLVEVYQAAFDARYLEAAVELAEQMIERFGDKDAGGFFYTADDHETLIVRNKDSQDSAIPSGNGMAATALLRLARLCGRTDFEEIAAATLDLLSGHLARAPMAGGQALIALDFHLGTTQEIAVVDGHRSDETDDETDQVLAAIHSRFLPNKVVLRKPHGARDNALPSVLRPILKGKTNRDGRTTIYLCEHGTCQEPVVGVGGLLAALDEENPPSDIT